MHILLRFSGLVKKNWEKLNQRKEKKIKSVGESEWISIFLIKLELMLILDENGNFK